MTPAGRLLAEARNLLAALNRFADGIERRHGFQPAPGSQAQVDWAAGYGVDIETAYSRASQGLGVSADYLECLRRVLREKVPERGVFMLCRGVVDNSSRAWWLMAPGADPRKRARRGLLERLNDVHELIRAKKSTDDVGALEVDVLRRELAGMVAAACRDGYEVRGKGSPSVDGLIRPSATALSKEMDNENGAFLYRFLSASTHGATYALLQGMDVEDDVEEWQGGLVAGPNDRFQPMGTLIARTIQVHCDAFERYVSLLGWGIPDWGKLHSRAMKSIVKLASAAQT